MLHGALLRGARGRAGPDPGGAFGLRRPRLSRASGPEHAHLRDSGRASYDTATDAEALRAFRELARLEGIIPALEPAHAIAWLLAEGGGGDGYDVLTLSGRGDKDMDEVTGKLAALDA